MNSWEYQDLLRRLTEAVESISASLERMNRLTEAGMKMEDFEQRASRLRQLIKGKFE